MSGYIDENARIADDIHNAYEEGYADGKHDVIKHGCWIPCKNGLPDCNEYVLVCLRWGVKNQCAIGWLSKDSTEWRFDDFDLSGDEFDDVVAWMPLPEPYKERVVES